MNKTLVFSVLALAVSLSPGLEPWARIGPDGITIAAMATVPGAANDLYVVTEGSPARIFYTSNAGFSWVERDSIPDRVVDIIVNPFSVQTLLAGGAGSRVYRTTNGGRDWSVRGNLAGSPHLHRLAFKPDQPLVVWAAADVPASGNVGLGIYTSSNGGADWDGTWVDTGYAATGMLLDPDPHRNYRLFLGGGIKNRARLFRSGDGGGNWRDITNGIGGSCAYAVAVCPTDSGILVCATDAGIYRSTNSGNSWSLVKAAPAWSVEFGTTSPHTGYAGSDNLVYRSDDNGATWDADTNEFYGTGTRWLSVNPSQSLEVYAASGAGAFHTTSGGFQWAPASQNLSQTTVPFVYFCEPDPEMMYACPPGRGIAMSEDRGLTWTMLEGFAGAGFTSGIAVNPRHPDTVIAVSRFDSQLHLTTDRGYSWVSFPVDDWFEAEGLLYNPTGPDTAYAWGGTRDSMAGRKKFTIYKTASKGQTWAMLASFGSRGTCTGFEYLGDGDTLYCWGSVDGSAALYRSTNRGGTWVPVKTGITGTEITDFKRSPDNDVYFCATPSGVFRTLNRGTNWTNLGLDHVTTVLPDTADEDAVWAGTDTQGFYYTTNAGSIWERDTLGLEARSVLFLRRHPAASSAVFCSIEGSGLYGRGVIGIAGPGERGSRWLTTVRPTLVSHDAVVHLSPGPDRRTTIDLYHADGRLAARIADLRSTPASYAWTRPGEIASGAYLLVVRSGQNRQVTKVILTGR